MTEMTQAIRQHVEQFLTSDKNVNVLGAQNRIMV